VLHHSQKLACYGVQVELVAQAGGERLDGAGGVVAAAVEAPVDQPAGHPQGYQDCFNAFVADAYAAIAGDQPDGLPTFADGLRAAMLTQAVVDSATSQTWVEVPL
jgi:predicted dehydrogenase